MTETETGGTGPKAGAHDDETAAPFRQTLEIPFESPFGQAVELNDNQPKGWFP